MAEKQVEQYYAPPPKLGKWEAFSIFLWNPETHQFLGRTGASWGKILLFYVLFYTCLAGFFSAMLAIFYQTLDMRTPKWELAASLIGNNPGLGFRPMPPERNVESTLIWYKGTDKDDYGYWVDELDKFLEPYKKPGEVASAGQNIQTCDYNTELAEGKVCEVNINEFAPCTEANKYNYHKSAPCIFLKINKIFNWMPLFYNETELPEKMPQDLKVHVREQKLLHSKMINTVWVSCEGENPADVENIGPIQYIPRRGFPGYYFPFKNYEGYLSPLVAVFFERPVHGVLINIECKAWAKNIVHDRVERRGSVHFELMVD